MPHKQNAHAHASAGVRDQLPGRIMDAYNTETALSQSHYLSARFGLSINRALLISSLAFGEAGHAR